jgi:hypothetical protein
MKTLFTPFTHSAVTRFLISAATLAPMGAVSTGIALTSVSCADENDPATWAKRLEDPAQRATAVQRLSGMFEKVAGDLKREGKDNTDPRMKEFLDKTVEPLTKQYTGSTLDEKTRKELIKFIADLRDVRAMPAFTKAFNELEAGKSEEDGRYAAVAVGGLAKEGKTDAAANAALWNCFAKLKHSDTKSEHTAREIQNALLAVKDPSFGPKAMAMLEMPVVNPKDPTEARDKIMFWQSVSLRVINELKFGGAAKTIIKLILTPTKNDLRALANKSIMLMPKDHEPLLIAALNGTDPDLAKLVEAYPEKGSLQVLSQALGQLSRSAGRDAVVAALPKATSDGQRAAMVESLASYSADKKATEAFLTTYGKLPVAAKLGEINARAALSQAAAMFYDRSMTPMLLKDLAASKGPDAEQMHAAALPTVIKIMGPEHSKDVEASIKKFGNPKVEGEMFTAANKVLSQCKEDAACYVKELAQPVPATPPAAKFGAVKACWMAAMYGDAKTGTALVGMVEKTSDDTVRLSMLEAIDHLFPKGDEASAKVLEKLVEQKVASGKTGGNDVIINIAYRLRARALP